MFEYLREEVPTYTENPFGTHRGEIMAWKRVAHHTGKKLGFALI
jgi:hypothetical protein